MVKPITEETVLALFPEGSRVRYNAPEVLDELGQDAISTPLFYEALLILQTLERNGFLTSRQDPACDIEFRRKK